MFETIKAALKAFLGGGSAAVYALLGSGLFGAYLYVQFLEASNEKLKTTNSQQAGQIRQLGNLNNTLAAKAQDKKDLDDKFDQASEGAKDVPDSKTISSNPSLLYTVDWLRDNPDTSRPSPD